MSGHSVSVAGVVRDDAGRVLVVRRRDTGTWEPPGGRLDRGEAVGDGLRREVLEETGLLVEPRALTGVYTHLVRGIVALVFDCRAVGGRLRRRTAETTDARWMAPSEVDAAVHTVFAVRIHDALDFAGTAAVRAHDGLRVVTDSPPAPVG